MYQWLTGIYGYLPNRIIDFILCTFFICCLLSTLFIVTGIIIGDPASSTSTNVVSSFEKAAMSGAYLLILCSAVVTLLTNPKKFEATYSALAANWIRMKRTAHSPQEREIIMKCEKKSQFIFNLIVLPSGLFILLISIFPFVMRRFSTLPSYKNAPIRIPLIVSFLLDPDLFPIAYPAIVIFQIFMAVNITSFVGMFICFFVHVTSMIQLNQIHFVEAFNRRRFLSQKFGLSLVHLDSGFVSSIQEQQQLYRVVERLYQFATSATVFIFLGASLISTFSILLINLDPTNSFKYGCFILFPTSQICAMFIAAADVTNSLLKQMYSCYALLNSIKTKTDRDQINL